MDTINNPFYYKPVEIYGEENCGDARHSIGRINNPNQNLLKRFCDVLPLENIENIIGPVSYNEFTYKGQNIAIFGEIHNVLSGCDDLPMFDSLSFSSFLISLLTQSSETYDVFVELHYKNPKRPDYLPYTNIMLSTILVDFGGCLRAEKNCPYKNLRAHYVDYRDIYEMYSDKELFLNISKNPHLLPPNQLIGPIYYSLHFYLDLNQNERYQFYNNIMKNIQLMFNTEIHLIKSILDDSTTKIAKQLRNSPLREEITEFAYKMLNDYTVEFHNLLDENMIFLTTTRNFSKAHMASKKTYIFFEKLVLKFMDLSLIIMDAYTLGRMFRTYQSSATAKNILVYAGESHAKVYVQFMHFIEADHIIQKNQDQFSYIKFDKRAKDASFLFKDAVISSPKAFFPRASSPRASSPRVSSPRASSPRASSPRVSSPRASSPRASSHRVSSPKASFPKASSPRASSPRVSSPRVSSPFIGADFEDIGTLAKTPPGLILSPAEKKRRREAYLRRYDAARSTLNGKIEDKKWYRALGTIHDPVKSRSRSPKSKS